MAQEIKTENSEASLKVVLCLALALITTAVFWSVQSNGFIGYGADQTYLLDNKTVQEGLTARGFKWAFQAQHATWQPVTWLSHMLDCQLFGLKAGAHHLVSLGLHISTALLLFLLLQRLTRNIWPSAVVAALFAWHPTHVESVAMAAARKDVLGGFFLVATLLLYHRYATSSAVGRSRLYYGASLFCFLLGLLANHLLAGLPMLLLLLDFWPLARTQNKGCWGRLMLEKVPFFALAAGGWIMATGAQRTGAVVAQAADSTWGHAALSYQHHLSKLFWPMPISPLYSAGTIPLGQISMVAIVLGLVCLGTIAFWRKYPWILVGWFWFAVMVAPTVGLGLSDRHSYLAAIGLFIVLAWTVFETFSWLPRLKLALVGVLAMFIAAMAPISYQQVFFWRNTDILLQRAIALGGGSASIHNALGCQAELRGDDEAALAYYNQSIKLTDNAQAHHNMGNIYLRRQKLDEAIRQFQFALNLDPKLASAQNSLGNALCSQNRLPEAIEHYKEALKISPDFALAHYNYAMALEDQQKLEEAAVEYAAAGRLGLEHANYCFNYGYLLNKLERYADAEPYLAKAAAANLNPEEAHFQYALALDRQGKYDEAIQEYRVVLQNWKDHPDTLNNLALIYATATDPELRSAKMAVLLATRACTASAYENPVHLDGLAQAFAADEDLASAIRWAERALTRADEKLRPKISARLDLYRSGKTN